MRHKIAPFAWIPTLYFAEGIPYFIVNNISVLMFSKMGVGNGEMALFTSLLYLPWTIKPLWSPFVDILRTKRWWILSMQLLMSVAFVLLCFTLARPSAEMIASGSTPMRLFAFTLVLFVITAFASATHDIAADGFYMLELDESEQSLYVGVRSTFYRLSNIFGQGVLVWLAGWVETRTGDIPLSWTITLGTAAVLFACVTFYHCFFLPRPVADHAVSMGKGLSKGAEAVNDFLGSFVTFFRKPGVVLAILFMLLYRLPEAFLLKMCPPFLITAKSAGGLGMSTEAVGLSYGTIGVAFLTLGGILGGVASSVWGFRRSLWPMAACMTLPCLSFVYLSSCLPDSLVIISLCIAVEQFGYGFGFTAYMLYMMRFSDGVYKTSHYAICTAFMALSMMLPGMVAGYLQEWLGYAGFFWMVIGCCVATVAVSVAAYIHVREKK